LCASHATSRVLVDLVGSGGLVEGPFDDERLGLPAGSSSAAR
jgi:hypothetical protein